jgi:hypothetical protein
MKRNARFEIVDSLWIARVHRQDPSSWSGAENGRFRNVHRLFEGSNQGECRGRGSSFDFLVDDRRVPAHSTTQSLPRWVKLLPTPSRVDTNRECRSTIAVTAISENRQAKVRRLRFPPDTRSDPVLKRLDRPISLRSSAKLRNGPRSPPDTGKTEIPTKTTPAPANTRLRPDSLPRATNSR